MVVSIGKNMKQKIEKSIGWKRTLQECQEIISYNKKDWAALCFGYIAFIGMCFCGRELSQTADTHFVILIFLAIFIGIVGSFCVWTRARLNIKEVEKQEC